MQICLSGETLASLILGSVIGALVSWLFSRQASRELAQQTTLLSAQSAAMMDQSAIILDQAERTAALLQRVAEHTAKLHDTSRVLVEAVGDLEHVRAKWSDQLDRGVKEINETTGAAVAHVETTGDESPTAALDSHLAAERDSDGSGA